MLTEQVAETIHRYNMLPGSARMGVAVSGGADSVCLLLVLVQLGWRPHVLHLNHGLRAGESDGDERFVCELAARLGLKVTVERWRKPEGAGNLEQQAREARYAFFAGAAGEHGLERIATGHTQTDQAETVLFRMMRGTSEEGLAGVRAVTREGIIRPLIEVSREQVRAWLTERHEEWREDSTNNDPRRARNRIRHELLPLLEQIRPGGVEAVARLAGLAAEDAAYWEEMVERAEAELGVNEPPFVVPVKAIGGHRAAFGKRLARRLLARTSGSARRFTSAHLNQLWALATKQAGEGRVELPGVEVRRSFGLLRFARAGEETTRPWSVELAGPGVAAGAGVRVEVIEETGDWDSRYTVNDGCFDADRVKFPLVLRGWQPGDRFQPEGRRAGVKLKDLLADLGVACWERPKWPMLVCGDEIVWSRGMGVAGWAAAQAGSMRRWRVRELDGSTPVT